MATVLIIDDEELVRFTLRQILAADGHEVTEARNGAEGYRMYLAQAVDVVVTDIIMPEQEGIETIIKLRSHNPDVKIIAISGGGRRKNMDFLKVAEKIGADVVLAKPFSMEELQGAVRACLN